jgi:SEC-C motif domain protein
MRAHCPKKSHGHLPCPCGGQKYATCCATYLDTATPAPTAAALMRSRYTAYTLQREEYLLATWHPSTRPLALGLAQEVTPQWLGLKLLRHECPAAAPTQALVEFVARYKINGRAHRLHEISHFVREAERWWYVTGEVS